MEHKEKKENNPMEILRMRRTMNGEHMVSIKQDKKELYEASGEIMK